MARRNLREDLISLSISVFFAWLLISSGALSLLLASSDTGKIVESFIVGIFFTSAFTIAPAAIFLAGLSETLSPCTVALVGAP